MTRRLTSVLLLTVLIAVQAGPLTAGVALCHMERSAPAALCSSCDVAPALSNGPLVSAGSCCRFEPAPNVSQASGVVTSIQRTHHDPSAAAASLAAAAPRDGALQPSASFAARSAIRSTDSPVTRSTTLRL